MLRPTVTKVIPQDNKVLYLEFDNGEQKQFDVKPYIKGSWFGKLNDDTLRLRFAAKNDNRSISQQVITILQNYFTSVPVKTKNATEEFLKLAGSWEDSRSASEIIDDIYESRTSSSLKRTKIFPFQFL